MRQIKSRTAMTKACNKEKNLFTSRLDLYVGKKLAKCYVWSIAVYSDEIWTLCKVDQIPKKFRNVVLKKVVEDYLNCSCEEWENDRKSQGGEEEYPTNNKKEED
jgi:hypothetical protein